MTLSIYDLPKTLWLLFLTAFFAHPSLLLAQSSSTPELRNSIANQVAADIVTATTHNTGDGTTVQSSHQQNTTTEVDSRNTAATNQSVTATANTGYNEATRNISIGGDAGVITTGNALIITDIVAAANSSATQINPYGSSASQDSDVLNSGEYAAHQTTTSQTDSRHVRGNNNAVIFQTTDAAANTGHNNADRNISLGGNAGVITTGNAGVSTNYLVAANSGVALIGGNTNGNGPGSGASIVSLNTGDHARYSASSSRLTQASIDSSNSADLLQMCGSSYSYSNQGECSAVTGYNTANRNISRTGDAGVITTGNAAVVIDMLANSNDTTTAATTQSNSASLQPRLANTGDSVSYANRTRDAITATASLFQDASLSQEVSATADTGHNTANRNISFGGDAGVITTGSALVNIRLSALSNTAESYLNSVWP